MKKKKMQRVLKSPPPLPQKSFDLNYIILKSGVFADRIMRLSAIGVDTEIEVLTCIAAYAVFTLIVLFKTLGFKVFFFSYGNIPSSKVTLNFVISNIFVAVE